MAALSTAEPPTLITPSLLYFSSFILITVYTMFYFLIVLITSFFQLKCRLLEGRIFKSVLFFTESKYRQWHLMTVGAQ